MTFAKSGKNAIILYYAFLCLSNRFTKMYDRIDILLSVCIVNFTMEQRNINVLLVVQIVRNLYDQKTMFPSLL